METKKLIVKFIIFSILLTSTYYFAMWKLSQGQIDYFYYKFTAETKSMIIGGSRAGDGISPEVIKQNFGKDKFDFPILNFAFAHQISDMGPVYFKAIEKKLDKNTKKGLFIVEVNPASFSILKTMSDDSITLAHENTILADMHHFNTNPNFEYIRKNYTHPLYKCFDKSRKIDIIRYSHKDGWQEVMKKCDSYEVSKDEISKWKQGKLDESDKMQKYFTPSKARIQYLEKVIRYFKKYGQVFLVRVPMSKEFLDRENDYWPEFNPLIEDIAAANSIGYFDYSLDGDTYETYDGSHLFGSAAKLFTQQLCNDIKSFKPKYILKNDCLLDNPIHMKH